jgi:hypothetical protein
MAVDRKTGKPVPDPGPHDPGPFERELQRRLASGDLLSEDAPPDAGPRGVSVLRGACGPWPALEELRELRAKGVP